MNNDFQINTEINLEKTKFLQIEVTEDESLIEIQFQEEN